MTRQVELKRYRTTLSMVSWTEVEEWARKPLKEDVIQALLLHLQEGRLGEYFTCIVEEV